MKTFALASVALGSAIALGSVIDLSKTTNRVEFLAVGTPSALKIRGKAKEGKLKGECKNVEGKFECRGTTRLEALDTGIEMRNDHMKNTYLEIAKYPEATVTVLPIQMPAGFDGGGSYEGPFTGTMLLHGVEKPVTGTAKIEKKAGKVNANFDFDIALSDFDVKIPSYLGITVSKKVAVNIGVEE